MTAELATVGGWKGLPFYTRVSIAGLLAYAVLFEKLGFVITTALATFALGLLFNGRLLPCLISGALMGVLLFGLFDLLLDVPLPLGVLRLLES